MSSAQHFQVLQEEKQQGGGEGGHKYADDEDFDDCIDDDCIHCERDYSHQPSYRAFQVLSLNGNGSTFVLPLNTPGEYNT